MFGKKSESKPQGRIDSLIGAGTRVEGSLYFTGGLRIEGGVTVAHLVTNGTVVGPVVITEILEMQPKARIVGDVEYASIEMHQGAVIDGRLLHSAGKSVELKLASTA